MIIRSLIGQATLLLALIGSATAADPAPASVSLVDGTHFDKAFVVSETLDGITWRTDDPIGGPTIQKKPGQYSVEYQPSHNANLLKAMKSEADHDPDKAIPSYTQALGDSKLDWERERAYLGIARMSEVAKKFDDGIVALQGFEKDYPKSLHLPEAIYLKARLSALKGDKPTAIKYLEGLRGHDKDWGPAAAAMGVLGIGEVLASDNKFKEAVAELSPWLNGKLSPSANGDEFARVGLALAQYQLKNGDDAAGTLRKVAFAPCPPDQQARAHLAWARMLADKPDAPSQLTAFDHAAIAATLKNVSDPSIRSDAIKLATLLVTKIKDQGADETAKNKLKIEYGDYLRKL